MAVRNFREKATFFVKATPRQMLRMATDPFTLGVERLKQVEAAPAQSELLAESVTPLFYTDDPKELNLQLGKAKNLRLAAAKLDGIYMKAGQTFSFWRQVGRLTAGKGYVEGNELRLGCMIASVGGGICQLSNSLHKAAMQSGCEIVERHAHSQKVPGSPFGPDEDATVFWPHVDVRFRSTRPLRLSVKIEGKNLRVGFYAG